MRGQRPRDIDPLELFFALRIQNHSFKIPLPAIADQRLRHAELKKIIVSDGTDSVQNNDQNGRARLFRTRCFLRIRKRLSLFDEFQLVDSQTLHQFRFLRDFIQTVVY